MTLTGITEITPNCFGTLKVTQLKEETFNEPILNFANNNPEVMQEISNGKVETELFKSKILRKIDFSKTQMSHENVKYYLGKLIKVAQILNGVQENKLKPQGNSKQNEVYNMRIQELKYQLKDYAEFISSNFSIQQDTQTGLYKISVNDKLYNIPKRQVNIVSEQTLDMIELVPEIVD